MLKNTEWVYDENTGFYKLIVEVDNAKTTLAQFYERGTGTHCGFRLSSNKKHYYCDSVEQVKKEVEKDAIDALEQVAARHRDAFELYTKILKLLEEE